MIWKDIAENVQETDKSLAPEPSVD